MVRTPQIGRRYGGDVARLNMDVDTELLYAVKRLALDERITVTRFVERALREQSGSGAPEAVGARRDGGETSRLSMNVDPELHKAVKGEAIGAGLSVRCYVERVLDEAVSAAQGTRGALG